MRQNAPPLPDSVVGAGFDYRFAIGIPEHWIRLTNLTPRANQEERFFPQLFSTESLGIDIYRPAFCL